MKSARCYARKTFCERHVASSWLDQSRVKI